MKKLIAALIIAILPSITMALPTIQSIKQHGIINAKQITATYMKAKEGDVYSQANLGGALINGSIGVLPNYERGLFWLQKAAKQESSLAYFNLALLYLQGNGVAKNDQMFYKYEKLALEIFNKKLAKKQYTQKQLATLRFFVGNAYFWGIPGVVKQNFKKALREYTLSANAGFVHSIQMVAFMHRNGIGERPNPTRANRWTALLANAGNIESQYQLGIDYLHGFGVKKDIDQAVIWIEKASRSGYFPATVEMYHLFRQGVIKLSPEVAANIGNVVKSIGKDIVDILQKNPLIKI